MESNISGSGYSTRWTNNDNTPSDSRSRLSSIPGPSTRSGSSIRSGSSSRSVSRASPTRSDSTRFSEMSRSDPRMRDNISRLREPLRGVPGEGSEIKETWGRSQSDSDVLSTISKSSQKSHKSVADSQLQRLDSSRSSEKILANFDVNSWQEGKWRWRLPEDGSSSSAPAKAESTSTAIVPTSNELSSVGSTSNKPSSVGSRSSRHTYYMAKIDESISPSSIGSHNRRISWEPAYTVVKSASKGTTKTEWNEDFWKKPSKSIISRASRSLKNLLNPKP